MLTGILKGQTALHGFSRLAAEQEAGIYSVNQEEERPRCAVSARVQQWETLIFTNRDTTNNNTIRQVCLSLNYG